MLALGSANVRGGPSTPLPLTTLQGRGYAGREEGMLAWRQGGVNVGLETSVLGALLFSGPGAVLLVGATSGRDRLFCH